MSSMMVADPAQAGETGCRRKRSRATEGSSESEGRTATSGNVSEYLDDAGDAVAHYEYSPFGVLTAAAGTMASDFRHRFSTKAFEAAGDSALPALYYYGYRYYAPRHGRWLSRDPIGEEGGLLLYGFCGNGPLAAVDALGLEHWGLTWYGKAATEDRGQVEAAPEKPLRPDQWTKRTSEYYDLDYEGTSGELMSLREAKTLSLNKSLF